MKRAIWLVMGLGLLHSTAWALTMEYEVIYPDNEKKVFEYNNKDERVIPLRKSEYECALKAVDVGREAGDEKIRGTFGLTCLKGKKEGFGLPIVCTDAPNIVAVKILEPKQAHTIRVICNYSK